MKRVLYLLGLIIAVAVVVLLGYYFRYRGGIIPPVPPAEQSGNLPATPVGQGGTSSTTSSTVTTGGSTTVSGAASILVDAPVFGYFVKSAGEATFIGPSGNISFVQNGKIITLNSDTIEGLMRADFSYDGSYLLVKSRIGTNPQLRIFSLAQKTWMSVPAGTVEATWSPSDNRLLILIQQGNATQLATFNAADPSAKLQLLTALNVTDVSLMWPDPLHIVVESHGSSVSEGFALLFDVKNKIFNASIENQLGFNSLWNNDGTRGLVWTSGARERGGTLSLMNSSGSLVHALSFATLPSKCTFGSTAASNTTGTAESLFCAIPRDQDGFLLNALPDDYEKGVFTTQDDFYRVGLAQGDLTLITANNSGETIDATQVSLKQGVLFFVNRTNGKLYALSMGK